MLGNFLTQSKSQLTLQLRQSIVVRYQKRKSIFDKTSYNPQWIPRLKLYHKMRKPSMPIWNDPDKVVPYLIPPMRKSQAHQTYLRNVVEQEQKQKSMRKKLYVLEPIRPGDIVDITYQQTFQNQNTVTHRGLVLSFKRKQRLTASIEMIVRLGGVNIKGSYLIHSPKIKDIKLISKGSGNFKGNLRFGWRKIGKKEALKPRIRNRVMKNRTNMRRKKIKRRINTMEYDKVKSDNVKRILKL